MTTFLCGRAATRTLCTFLGAAAACACGSNAEAPEAPIEASVTLPGPGEKHELLSQWHLFTDAARQQPASRVVPYEVNSTLFADFAYKRRFLWIPDDERIGYEDTDKWRFPLGTVLVKTFYYPDDMRDPQAGERLLETRLLVHESDSEWGTYTYAWNEEQTDAKRSVSGSDVSTSWIDAGGKKVDHVYSVPPTAMCQNCHFALPDTDTLGGRTRQLDRDTDYGSGPENQLDHLAALDLFDAAPPAAEKRQRLVDPLGDAPVLDRARAYLDANCAHCHTPGGFAESTNFWVDYEHTDPDAGLPANWGVCKKPTSAGGATCGLEFDVVPGDPENSILVCRVASEEQKIHMPPIASKLADPDGVTLMRDWVAGMEAAPCGGR